MIKRTKNATCKCYKQHNSSPTIKSIKITNSLIMNYYELCIIGTLKPQSNGPLYSNTQIGTLAVDGWVVTFGTARRGLPACAGCGPAQSPPRCTKCNSPPINGQCTNFILFDVAL